MQNNFMHCQSLYKFDHLERIQRAERQNRHEFSPNNGSILRTLLASSGILLIRMGTMLAERYGQKYHTQRRYPSHMRQA